MSLRVQPVLDGALFLIVTELETLFRRFQPEQIVSNISQFACLTLPNSQVV
jgi:hypothetical protein